MLPCVTADLENAVSSRYNSFAFCAHGEPFFALQTMKQI